MGFVFLFFWGVFFGADRTAEFTGNSLLRGLMAAEF